MVAANSTFTAGNTIDMIKFLIFLGVLIIVKTVLPWILKEARHSSHRKLKRDSLIDSTRRELAIAESNLDASNACSQEDLAARYENAGDLLSKHYASAEALSLYVKARTIREGIAVPHPISANSQHDLAILWKKTGASFRENGMRDEALRAYMSSVTILKRLADEAEAPHSKEWQELADSHEKIKSLRNIRYDSLKILAVIFVIIALITAGTLMISNLWKDYAKQRKDEAVRSRAMEDEFRQILERNRGNSR